MLGMTRVRAADWRGNSAVNVLLHYEHVAGASGEYLVLHRVQVELTEDSALLLDVPLDDDAVREHFEHLLSVSECNLDVKRGVVV